MMQDGFACHTYQDIADDQSAFGRRAAILYTDD